MMNDTTQNKDTKVLVDPGQRHKATTKPSNLMNRVLVMEILTLAGCHDIALDKETPVDKNWFWQSIESTTLEVHKKKTRIDTWQSI